MREVEEEAEVEISVMDEKHAEGREYIHLILAQYPLSEPISASVMTMPISFSSHQMVEWSQKAHYRCIVLFCLTPTRR